MRFERIYRTILENMSEQVYVRDLEMNLLYVNAAAEELTGWSLSEALGKKCYDVFGDEDLICRDTCPVNRALAGQTALCHHEGKLKTRSGDIRRMQISISPLYEGEALGGAIVVMQDITQQREMEQNRVKTMISLEKEIQQRRQIEQALREAEREKDLILSSVSELVTYQDRDLCILWASRVAGESVNLPVAELLGRHCYEVWSQRSEPCVGCPVLEAIRTGKPREAEMSTPDGRIWAVKGYPVQAEDGTIVGAVEITREITGRKRAEKAISRQTETLAALHETALDLAAQRGLQDLLQAIVGRAVELLQAKGGGIYLYRPATDDLEYVFTYEVGGDTLGTILKRGQGLSGKVLEQGFSIAVADYDTWEGRTDQLTGIGFGACVAVPICWGERVLGVLNVDDSAPRTFSDEDIALLERFTPLAAAALENQRLLGSLQQQMDELKSTQAQLVRSAKLAAVGELAAGVAHELNNPLTSVLGFAEILAEETGPDFPFWEELGIIASEAKRARDIVRSLLDFARQTKPARQLADINQVLHQTLNVIRHHLEKVGINIEEAYSPTLNQLLLDVGQMKQVFLNLISNAVYAMPQGGMLRLHTEQIGGEVAISISDTGVGIRQEKIEQIFDPFYSTKPAGTGLGLSVSLGIVQEHEGRITVESKVGQGSTFTVWLPVGRGE